MRKSLNNPTQGLYRYGHRQRREAFSKFLIGEIRTRHGSKEWASVTLTLKQFLRRGDGTWQFLTRTEAEKCVKRLLKAVNRKVYGPAYRRFSKRLAVIPAIEGGGEEKRLHIHLTLQIPDRMLARKEHFFGLVLDEWRRILWADRETDIKWLETAEDVSRWTNYLTKEMCGNADVIDLNNLYL